MHSVARRRTASHGAALHRLGPEDRLALKLDIGITNEGLLDSAFGFYQVIRVQFHVCAILLPFPSSD